jgi:hypothetical protein
VKAVKDRQEENDSQERMENTGEEDHT